jgi:hypothetical protein
MKHFRQILILTVTTLGLVGVQTVVSRSSTSTNDSATATAGTVVDDPCAALTPAAIKAVIAAIDRSRIKANADAAANGTGGEYASAARDNAARLSAAYDKMVALQTWLANENLGSPHVTNATAAYNVHGYTREALGSMYEARHWATVSAAHHRSSDARNSFDLTTEAIALAESLGANGGRCYMSGYFR